MISLLHSNELYRRSVLLRADLNVPLRGTTVVDDFKLEAIRPTLTALKNLQAKTIIATHLGQPVGRDPLLSTTILCAWFLENGFHLTHTTLEEAPEKIAAMEPGTFLLLENLRYHAEEQNPTLPKAQSFAQKLNELAPYYVQDAWALSHKKDTSITLVPQLYKPTHKTIGLLMEKELRGLAPLLEPQRPFVIIMAGAKLRQKLPLIEKALEVADTVIVLPALAYTFLKAAQREIGTSLVDTTLLTKASAIVASAQAQNKKLIIPQDFTYAHENQILSTLREGDSIPADALGIAVGPKTLAICANELAHAKTIFLNGMMGFFEYPPTLDPQKKLLQSIAQSVAYSVIGGGDSVAAVNLLGKESAFSFISTGGGATLQYILEKKACALSYLE